LFYPARFEPAHEGGYVVTFRDIPEAITQGETMEEAMEMAADVLVSSMDFYVEDRRPVPMPSKAKRGETMVELPPSAAAKVLLLNELIAQDVSNAELARRLHTSPQTVQRIVDLGHQTKIDTLAHALQCLGRNLEIRVV